MRKPSLRTALLLSLLVCCVSAAAAQSPATIILVRHAEKSAPTGDVPLSDAGRARAQALAHVLADAQVKTIFVTEFKRTQETAAPLAAETHVTPEVRAAADVDRTIAELRKMPAGSTTVVVGHSNTIPEMIAKLGAGAVKIEDGEYFHLYIVTMESGKAHLLSMRF